MSNAQGMTAPVSDHARVRGPGHTVVRIAVAAAQLIGQLLLLAAYWPWAHYRATAGFRRALRQAGLPPEAVARLAETYASAGSPVELLRLALKTRR